VVSQTEIEFVYKKHNIIRTTSASSGVQEWTLSRVQIILKIKILYYLYPSEPPFVTFYLDMFHQNREYGPTIFRSEDLP
jgi:hypothetical protein